MMSLPQAVADRFLGIATGGQIKVILCLFRFQDMPLTKAEMAKQCNISEEDVADAILYLADAEFMTGQVLGINGGFVI